MRTRPPSSTGASGCRSGCGRAPQWARRTGLRVRRCPGCTGAPRSAVTGIARAGDRFAVTDADGRTEEYPVVVFTAPHRVLVTKVEGARALFSAEDWTALERTHYM